MPFVTVQLGQCGNQLGASWFETLAQELGSGGYGAGAADACFRQQECASSRDRGGTRWVARAVMADMEPKVIRCAQQAALASSHGWCYAPGCAAAGHGGSGNNWALGHNKYGPAMGPALLELVRQQVEACDVCEGFLLLQSMAGGTGAGAGTFLAEQLADEYGSGHLLNCCVWPYSSGEVTVQPYNTLLSMAALGDVSSGLLLLQNEVLHATCTRLLGTANPGFQDLNTVAARGLASVLLPSRPQPAAAQPAPPPSPPSAAAAGAGRQGRANGSSAAAAAAVPGLEQLPLHPLSDVVCHLFSHPSYRVASLRCLPQLPASSVDFTSFAWPAMLRRVKAMGVSGSFLDEGLSAFLPNPGGSGLAAHKYRSRAASALLVLRGSGAGSVSAAELADPAWYASWAVDPLLVACHSAKFGGCPMSASLLATDQAAVAPLRPMLGRAYGMLSARAYVHQYAAHGLGLPEFEAAFAGIEDVLDAYGGLA